MNTTYRVNTVSVIIYCIRVCTTSSTVQYTVTVLGLQLKRELADNDFEIKSQTIDW